MESIRDLALKEHVTNLFQLGLLSLLLLASFERLPVQRLGRELRGSAYYESASTHSTDLEVEKRILETRHGV